MARLISVILTIILALQMVLSLPEARGHGLFPLMVLGLLLGFLHSLDFSSGHRIRKYIFGPPLAWPLMGGSIFYFLSQAGFI